MLSFLTDELVWAAIREREDEARTTQPHTSGWPVTERSMFPPNPLRWLSAALRGPSETAPQYR
ncbi:MAG TPA: hypothetical protein VGR43_10465 [Dehalococcoidia bacterium]|nr:hypothetical protein [Dehalococcoidia bacterium]